ncbi:MAG: thioredoxin domain-containing protein [Candidatus Thiodiazotropha sp.]
MELQQKLKTAYLAKGPDYHPRTEHLNADGSPKYINRLILEDSPYLLQHAHNPVDWRAWSEAAFEAARTQDKPVFLSIGYSTCHWCHVMERESFEDPAIAALLNQHFIPIKVDRESHPDVDEVYMTAVTMLTGHGGWPMSTFLTPRGEPFYGGTYYPPQQFASLLKQVAQVWRERRGEVESQATQIARAVAENNRLGELGAAFDPAAAPRAVALMSQIYDEIEGGFGQAPKFPQEPWLYLLLDQAERQNDPRALEMLENTLDHMARGGIQDQIGGGFHRYSTDYEWLVPHFEKMLYNQASLSRIYLGAWRLTGKARYRRTATRTLDYVMREMTAPDGGFYSATDADSEGEEGLFFTWTPAELRDALSPEDAELARSFYQVSRIGNFEGRNILHRQDEPEAYAAAHGLDPAELQQRIERIDGQLLAVRGRRIPPLRDDKIVTAWNGMMITAFAQAADLLDDPAYRRAAERAAAFLWRQNRPSPGRLLRVHLDGRSSVAGTLEDYAYLAEAMLYLYDLSGDRQWLDRARELADSLIDRFVDTDGGFFLNEAEAGITAMGRPRDDGTDNATASGSSVALQVLQRLSTRSDDIRYRQQLERLIGRFAPAVAEHPHSYGYLLTAITSQREGELGARAYAAGGGIRLQGRMDRASGGQRQLKVTIDIPEGWHINASDPNDPALTATRLETAAGWRLQAIAYPPGETRQLAFQEQPLSLYAGTLELQATVAPGNGSPAGLTLPVSVQLQACNDEVCLPPEQVTLRLPLH